MYTENEENLILNLILKSDWVVQRRKFLIQNI
jgi:hypothetical protein